MGCCFSRPAGPNAPYPGGATSPSARAINSQPALHAVPTDDSSAGSRRAAAAAGATASSSSPASPTTSAHHRPRRRRHHHHDNEPPLSQHIDKPLRLHQWAATDRPWTRTALDTERTEFFDTRVTGRPEVWQVIKVALEVLWDADRAKRKAERTRQQQHSQHATASAAPGGQHAQTGDGAAEEEDTRSKSQDETTVEALATAQGILKAAEVTLPTGNLANGVYDSLGNYYPLSEWIVCDPVNVAEDSGSSGDAAAAGKSSKHGGGGGGGGNNGEENPSSDVDEEEAARRREEKGKGVAVVKDLVPVRARLSESGRDLVIRVGMSETVRSLARKITEESSLPSNKRIRVAYMGKILSENTPLEDQGWQKGHIVNAFVFNR
ncbi:uncharacterized protein B0I36DRAFT_343479 [Microdochium trichocladiopsis]|uniref:Ubiquitin-like domain-containing protein n=1 Tax=Microdochium trichocladiopsis TaxID=1682393 RepID=A0A9P9BVJ0_9PEZI|nr:uncharacterized protein B0I36DRAFT_343479 [Microdochium trichocladiopsis]KAH7039615.1 hypothetical protein B0I36DRAFT_343479 [Microdochium trichocladiopsis]